MITREGPVRPALPGLQGSAADGACGASLGTRPQLGSDNGRTQEIGESGDPVPSHVLRGIQTAPRKGGKTSLTWEASQAVKLTFMTLTRDKPRGIKQPGTQLMSRLGPSDK